MASYNNPSTFLDGMGLREECLADPNGLSDAQLDAIGFQSSEIYALARAIDNLYARSSPGPALRVELMRSLVRYDLLRNQQIERLKAQLLDALQWSVKPMQFGVVKNPK